VTELKLAWLQRSAKAGVDMNTADSTTGYPPGRRWHVRVRSKAGECERVPRSARRAAGDYVWVARRDRQIVDEVAASLSASRSSSAPRPRRATRVDQSKTSRPKGGYVFLIVNGRPFIDSPTTQMTRKSEA
jgi:hypothetical protein